MHTDESATGSSVWSWVLSYIKLHQNLRKHAVEFGKVDFAEMTENGDGNGNTENKLSASYRTWFLRYGRKHGINEIA